MSLPSTVPSPTCFSRAGNAFEIAELGQTRLDGHAQRRARLDRVEAKIVAHVVEPGDIIQVAQAQIRAEQGDRLVLQRADDGLPGFIHIQIATGNHTAGHAARARCGLRAPG